MFANRYQDGTGCRHLRPEDIEEWHVHLKETTLRLREKGPRTTPSLNPAMNSHIVAVLRRTLCVTAGGYLGVCPETVSIGDEIFILYHSPAPIFLRLINNQERDAKNMYQVLGHGYVHGLMDGEAMQKDCLKQQVLLI